MLNLTGYIETDFIYAGTRTIVYRGTRSSDSQPVIIKVLRNSHPNFNELVQFRNQYVIARNLKHPAIVRPEALERYGNAYALVMPDTGEVALMKYWQQSNRSLAEFLSVGIQLADALHYLIQQRIIHKDIKPGNILIHPETGKVKLIDFSISSLLPKEQQQLANPNLLEGTLAYISPEQTGRMNRGIDYRTDFYSLGATFFELLAGKLPFETTEPMDLVHCHIARMPSALGKRQEAILGKRQEARGKRVGEIPGVLSDIVLKLMAKNAEDRYQSALGLKYDLERCLERLEATGEIASFEIGTRDKSDRFIIPEKLYGRETEVQTLLDAFDRVASGKTEIMLVAGFSGIGKTAVVNEVHKPIVEKRGYFIKGKFDQFNRNIPLDAFVQAFQDLTRQLLGEADWELAAWKAQILEAVGENAQVIIDAIPELEKIIGKQPTVAELSGSAAQNRFNLVFGEFIRVFTTTENPLVIFLDDLQWADSGSLNLLKLLMDSDASVGARQKQEAKASSLLVLGAYRDNEVFPAHPLMLTLDDIAKGGATLNTLTLTPLAEGDITRLVADTLMCSTEIAAPLSELVYQKTEGNPFFTTQFLKGLHEDGPIAFDADAGYWQCDLTGVRQLALTEDVVEFMVGRLRKLPEATQFVLKQAAFIGNRFGLAILAAVCDRDRDEVAVSLWTGLQEGFIVPESETYKFFHGEGKERNRASHTLTLTHTQKIEDVVVCYRFLHDRVQQAAYNLVPEEQKTTYHYRIGRCLLAEIPTTELEDYLFEIVNHLNQGKELVSDRSEADRLVELNLQAGRKAKNATVYQSARNYYDTARSLIASKNWQADYKIHLEIYIESVEIAFLCGEFDEMEELAKVVLQEVREFIDGAKVYEIKVQAAIAQNQLDAAIQLGLDFLENVGLSLPQQVSPSEIAAAYAENDTLLEAIAIEDVLHFDLIDDPYKEAAVRMITIAGLAMYIANPELLMLAVAKQVNLCLQYGNTSTAADAYATYGLFLCGEIGDLQQGYRFGQLAVMVLEKYHTVEIKSLIYVLFNGFIKHWQEPCRETLADLQNGYRYGLETGDLQNAALSAYCYCAHLFACGFNLKELLDELERYGEAVESIQQMGMKGWLEPFRLSTIKLLEPSSEPVLLLPSEAAEKEAMENYAKASDRAGIFLFAFHKSFLAYMLGESKIALKFAKIAKEHLDGVTSMAVVPCFYFYDSLIFLSQVGVDADSIPPEILERVASNQEKLHGWSQYAPQNLEHKYRLVEAAYQVLQGNLLEAQENYDRAIESAKENEYLQEEALANELAAKFYLNWGREKIAATYMQEAYYCYVRWGAKAKTDELEAKYPQLLAPILQQQRVALNPIDSLESIVKTFTSTIRERTQTQTYALETLDFAAILLAAQTLSSTIELDELLATIVRIILTNAGAQKAVLLVPQKDRWQVRAMAKLTEDGSVETSTKPQPLTAESPVPVRLVQYVKNTQRPILLEEANSEITGILQGYMLKYQPQSAFCVPLVDRGNLVAILYLEHQTTKGAFARNRQTVVKFLCAQAAIALENAKLYEQTRLALLELKEAQLQLVQSEKMSVLGNLVSGIAHEINNPIGFLQGNLQPARNYAQDLLNLIDLLLKNVGENKPEIDEILEEMDLEFVRQDLPELLESMNIGIERIRNISNSLRTFSRTDADRKVAFNLDKGIDSTLLILKHRMKANQKRPAIKIVKEYAELPEVQCFPGQLNQVFMNILANAIDAFEEANEGKTYFEIEANPNRITIRTAMVENWAQILIIDNAGGMKPETIERIFDQGFTTKGVGKGTGLGMAIARNIVTEKHGGTITCDSILGVGTTFTIALP